MFILCKVDVKLMFILFYGFAKMVLLYSLLQKSDQAKCGCFSFGLHTVVTIASKLFTNMLTCPRGLHIFLTMKRSDVSQDIFDRLIDAIKSSVEEEHSR